MMQCTAKSKRSGQPCRNPAVTGRTTCRMHGGTTPVGFASATWKTGRYSKVLPPRLLERYEQARNDPHLLEANHEIALIDSRLAEVLEAMDAAGSAQQWEEARGAYRRLAKARDAGDTASMRAALTDLGTVLEQREAGAEYWADIERLVALRQKLAEGEGRRIVAARQVLRLEQAVALVGALTAAVKQHVADPTARAAIAASFHQIMNRAEVPGGLEIDEGEPTNEYSGTTPDD